MRLFLISALICLGLFIFLLNYPVRNNGGDIVEYFGMNESLLKDQTVALTDTTLKTLTKALDPGYFTPVDKDQNGGMDYYIKGKDGKYYPVHFFLYSLLAIVPRIFLHIFNLNELNTFRLTNFIVLVLTMFLVMHYFLKSDFKKAVFFVVIFLSPIAWFIIWPGPDVFYLSLLTMAVYLFFANKILLSVLFTAFASWHSQPLGFMALGLLAVLNNLNFKTTLSSLAILAIVAFPYVYNYVIFGVLAPYTLLRDGWTQIFGFGLHNISSQKTFEMIFDPNIGLFWYAPVLLLIGGLYLVKSTIASKKIAWIVLLLLITALLYQTNPAVNYGTSGFGPTRHVLFLLPFLIYFTVDFIKPTKVYFIIILLFVMSQVYVMSWNGYLTPQVYNVLNHSPYAKFLLDNYPQGYNPTPEVFVDRTNHNDLKILKTAAYKEGGVCKKAYVTTSDIDYLKTICPGSFYPQKIIYYQGTPSEGFYVDF